MDFVKIKSFDYLINFNYHLNFYDSVIKNYYPNIMNFDIAMEYFKVVGLNFMVKDSFLDSRNYSQILIQNYA